MNLIDLMIASDYAAAKSDYDHRVKKAIKKIKK